MPRGVVARAIFLRALTVALLSIGFSPLTFAAADGETGTIRGVILDTHGGTPVDKVLALRMKSPTSPSR